LSGERNLFFIASKGKGTMNRDCRGKKKGGPPFVGESRKGKGEPNPFCMTPQRGKGPCLFPASADGEREKREKDWTEVLPVNLASNAKGGKEGASPRFKKMPKRGYIGDTKRGKKKKNQKKCRPKRKKKLSTCHKKEKKKVAVFPAGRVE